MVVAAPMPVMSSFRRLFLLLLLLLLLLPTPT